MGGNPRNLDSKIQSRRKREVIYGSRLFTDLKVRLTMPQVKPANAKYQYDMKSIMQQSHMTKCQKYDNRREDRLLNRKLEELR